MIDPINLSELDLKKYFICVECEMILLNPHEKQCCGGLICEECIESYKSKNYNKCKDCESFLFLKPNSFAKRLLNQMKSIKCIYDCGIEDDCNKIRLHSLQCTERVIQCSECSYKGNKQQFKLHFLDNHEDTFLSMFEIHKKNKGNKNKKDDNKEEPRYNKETKYKYQRSDFPERIDSVSPDNLYNLDNENLINSLYDKTIKKNSILESYLNRLNQNKEIDIQMKNSYIYPNLSDDGIDTVRGDRDIEQYDYEINSSNYS